MKYVNSDRWPSQPCTGHMATSKGISETLSNLSFSGALVLVSAGTQGTFGAKISGTTGWCLIKKINELVTSTFLPKLIIWNLDWKTEFLMIIHRHKDIYKTIKTQQILDLILFTDFVMLQVARQPVLVVNHSSSLPVSGCLLTIAFRNVQLSISPLKETVHLLE